MKHERTLVAPVQVMLSRAERRQWRAAARRHRATLSAFVRAVVRPHLTADPPAGDAPRPSESAQG